MKAISHLRMRAQPTAPAPGPRIAGTVDPEAVDSARRAVRARDSLSRLQKLSRDEDGAPAVARALQRLLRDGD
ncbi:MAG: hypothetical protein GVY13_06995 [Alphaproteobacteria bacterium]|jgi:hypothetical protein|nr:hypothetical protein [Alphaproteobacteria bacterium]